MSISISGGRPVKRATVKDVARRAGVSVATVSRALAGSDAVRPETAERVHEAAHALHYVPHGGARSLATNRTNTVGVMLPDIHGEFFSELIRGLDRTARRNGYLLLVSGFHSNRRDVEAMLGITRGRVDGLVLMTPDVEAPCLDQVIAEGMPVVLVNGRAVEGDLDSLEVDNVGGAAAAVRHLAALGHRSIALVSGPESNHDARGRRDGYRRALRELGLPSPAELEIAGDFTEAAGHLAADALRTMRSRPTAVFAANDAMAIGLLASLRDAGVRVPSDLAVVGFDDIPAARWVSPMLTSVRVDIAALGARAMECLLHAIACNNSHCRAHETAPAALVVRQSCGAVREPEPRHEPLSWPAAR